MRIYWYEIACIQASVFNILEERTISLERAGIRKNAAAAIAITHNIRATRNKRERVRASLSVPSATVCSAHCFLCACVCVCLSRVFCARTPPNGHRRAPRAHICPSHQHCCRASPSSTLWPSRSPFCCRRRRLDRHSHTHELGFHVCACARALARAKLCSQKRYACVLRRMEYEMRPSARGGTLSAYVLPLGAGLFLRCCAYNRSARIYYTGVCVVCVSVCVCVQTRATHHNMHTWCIYIIPECEFGV